ncbi:ABC transporter ATP-binding protein [Desulfosporosinus metallidurans]|uniref:Oligopeptide transport ATP-binding protein OppD n=1 Tax=Desulfosporosinus metallidurans TaxID=1888891 RepID=A0A1Q8R022_9FIRM|nr:ABC transporter ATP-binding protein [Desulfosporosinus metallidurans]OLN32979.1 Oligopeptide transport ATP-binding protein OppD [Desulfosporosinus metallidurans]
MTETLIDIKNLVTSFKTPEGPLRVLDDVCLTIKKGKVLGVVGESGCGKSITSLSIMRLLPQPYGFIESGEIIFNGADLTKLSTNEMESIRGNDIAMIFQEPMTALNPVFTIGYQIGEALEIHLKLKGNEKREKSIEMLKMVGLPRAEKLIDEYPHQLSGGMRQRVMIAMALSCNPKLLIADEPTTALDVTIQIQILELMKNLKNDFNTSVLLITHDLGVIAEMSDEVAVMYLGKIVEYTTAENIFDNPLHPYTEGLLNSRLVSIQRGTKLICIPGMVPTLTCKPKGCAFSPRCSKCMDICKEKMPELKEIKPNHKARCWLYN